MTARLAALALLAVPLAAAQPTVPLADALQALAQSRSVRLVYAVDLVAGRATLCPASIRQSARPVADVLACVLRETGVEARRLPSGTVALYAAGGRRDPAAPARRAPPPTPRARPAAPRTVTLSGFVRDAATGEALVGATVYAPALGRGVATNGYGFYALALPAGRAIVRARSVGYAPRDTALAVAADLRVDLGLDASDLGEVVVEADGAVPDPPGAVRLSAAEVERVPVLLGEADPMKALQLASAAGFGAEGSAGLHVRGGSPDQTLLLLDGAPVYNAAHLAGAVSVFNSDALASVSLVPGAPPARYGDRLSGVVDVAQREGSRDRLGATATVGLLSSRALVEGPLAGGRGSFLVSGRRTYADVLARPLLYANGAGSIDYSIGYYFQDATATASYDVDGRTRVFASAYGGRDRFHNRYREPFGGGRTASESTEISWGNATGSVRATRVLSPRAFASAVVYASRYAFAADRQAGDEWAPGTGRTSQSTAFRQSSGLFDLAARADIEVSARALGLDHAAELGAAVERRRFLPAQTARRTAFGEAEDLEAFEDRQATLGGAVYASNAVRLGPVRAEGGLRVGWLAVRDRVFVGLQPRLAATAAAGPWTMSASAGRSWQPLHLLSNAGVGLPTDLWVPATDRVPPSSAWQAALSAGRPLGRGWTGNVGVTAKSMAGLVEYRDAASFFSVGGPWEDEVATGTGRAVGLEVALGRTGGRTEAQVAYALGRSTRTFPEVDFGRTFPYRYGRTHDLSATLTRHLSLRRRFTALFVYATGAAVTVPVATGSAGLVYGARNGHRLPDYHRVDVSYEVDYGRGRLALGLYNAYNRRNPYYVRFGYRYDEDRQDTRAGFTYVSLFPTLPSVSWRFAL